MGRARLGAPPRFRSTTLVLPGSPVSAARPLVNEAGSENDPRRDDRGALRRLARTRHALDLRPVERTDDAAPRRERVSLLRGAPNPNRCAPVAGSASFNRRPPSRRAATSPRSPASASRSRCWQPGETVQMPVTFSNVQSRHSRGTEDARQRADDHPVPPTRFHTIRPAPGAGRPVASPTAPVKLTPREPPPWPHEKEPRLTTS